MLDPNGAAARLQAHVAERFGEEMRVDPDTPHVEELEGFLAHRSHRDYDGRTVPAGLLRLLFASALSAPSKSDLQQADIVHVIDPTLRATIANLIPDMPWVRAAPTLLVVCGNNRRTRRLGELRGKPFANDHLDAFMNAAVDAGIVLATFIRAAEAIGLGCCPISAVRNHAATVSELLGLPDWVFPLAGLCVGYPASEGRISPRLPLDVTVHRDRYDEAALDAAIDVYDRRRAALQPYAQQRYIERYGEAPLYGWSEDKARQYAQPEREDFGAFIRAKRFNLD